MRLTVSIAIIGMLVAWNTCPVYAVSINEMDGEVQVKKDFLMS